MSQRLPELLWHQFVNFHCTTSVGAQGMEASHGRTRSGVGWDKSMLLAVCRARGVEVGRLYAQSVCMVAEFKHKENVYQASPASL